MTVVKIRKKEKKRIYYFTSTKYSDTMKFWHTWITLSTQYKGLQRVVWLCNKLNILRWCMNEWMNWKRGICSVVYNIHTLKIWRNKNENQANMRTKIPFHLMFAQKISCLKIEIQMMNWWYIYSTSFWYVEVQYVIVRVSNWFNPLIQQSIYVLNVRRVRFI